MDQNAKKIGLINWIVLLVATSGLALVSQFVNSAAGLMAAILVGCGFLVAIVSYFQMRLEERERFEKLEFDEINKSRGSSTIFSSPGDDTFPAKRSREQFEKFFVPAFTTLLFLAQAAAAYFLWKLLEKMPPLVPERMMLAMSLLGLFALVLFLLGKYSAGLARIEGQRLLRPAAGYLLLSAYLCFVAAASMASVQAGFPKIDFYVGRALCVVIGLAAIETLIGLILEIYRVRIKGRESHLLYESRLVGLLGQPEGLLATAAHTLDYQFGFKVSETWFYRFFEKIFAVFMLAQIVVLILSTCFVFVDAGEQALLERFGAPVAGREILTAGLHFKLPWPIDKVRRYHSEKIQSFVVGSEGDPEVRNPANEKTVLWSVAHAKEDNLIVASREPVAVVNGEEKKSPPVNLISVGVPVQFQITNLLEWAYINEDPDELMRKLSSREVVRYLASADIDEVMARGRTAAGQTLREHIQSAADQFHLGAKILYVGIEDIHPPVKVAEDFERVIGAMQKKESKILDAKAYAYKANAVARADAFKRERDAESERTRRIADGSARAAMFTNQVAAYSAAPLVYPQRAYLQTFARGSVASRKYVIAVTNTADVVQLNLEDKVDPSLIDKMIEKVTTKK